MIDQDLKVEGNLARMLVEREMEESVLGDFAMVKFRLKSDKEDETSANDSLEVARNCPGDRHHRPFCSNPEDATQA